jgi:hypothetical protein
MTESVNTNQSPDGYLMIDDPETGLLSPLAYWLPEGVTFEDTDPYSISQVEALVDDRMRRSCDLDLPIFYTDLKVESEQ